MTQCGCFANAGGCWATSPAQYRHRPDGLASASNLVDLDAIRVGANTCQTAARACELMHDGRAEGSVLPEPVSARPMTSRPARPRMAFRWMRVGLLSPTAWHLQSGVILGGPGGLPSTPPLLLRPVRRLLVLLGSGLGLVRGRGLGLGSRCLRLLRRRRAPRAGPSLMAVRLARRETRRRPGPRMFSPRARARAAARPCASASFSSCRRASNPSMRAANGLNLSPSFASFAKPTGSRSIGATGVDALMTRCAAMRTLGDQSRALKCEDALDCRPS